MNKSILTRNQSPVANWQREMNKLFEQWNRELDFTTDLGAFEPKVEVKDKNREYVVRAEIPGIPEKDLHLSFRDNCLILEGERKSEEEKEGNDYYRSEFSYGSFYRAIPFEDEVNADSVDASYKNGILTVHLAKTGDKKHGEKSIPIKLS